MYVCFWIGDFEGMWMFVRKRIGFSRIGLFEEEFFGFWVGVGVERLGLCLGIVIIYYYWK